MEAPAAWVSGEGALPGSQVAIFLPSPHMVKGTGKLSGVSFIRALNPFMRALPS